MMAAAVDLLYAYLGRPFRSQDGWMTACHLSIVVSQPAARSGRGRVPAYGRDLGTGRRYPTSREDEGTHLHVAPKLEDGLCRSSGGLTSYLREPRLAARLIPLQEDWPI